MKPIIFVNTEVLEKGRPAAAIGTRKMQSQKRMKDGKQIITWVWMKKTFQDWKYDGMVSPSEKKIYDLTQRKTKKGNKLKEQTAARVAEAKAAKEAKDAGDVAATDTGHYKHTQAELDAMPTKERAYWSSPDVTDSRRQLCDITGILTMDDQSEKYVRDNMKTIFTMSTAQKKLLSDINATIPVGTDGKAWDDPIFIEDTLENLKAMYSMLMSPKQVKKREDMLSAEYQAAPGLMYGFNGSYDYVEKSEQALINGFEEMIEMFEKKGNDLILLNKIAAWDKGVRGAKNMIKFDQILVQSIFGTLNVGGNPDYSVPWDQIPKKSQAMLEVYGITEDKWKSRGWGASELYGFQMSSVNDEYRNTVFQPWLNAYGNVVMKQEVFKDKYSSTMNAENYHRYWTHAEMDDVIDTDINMLAHNAALVQKNMNPLTVQFMQTNFKYKDVGWDQGNLTVWRDELIDSTRVTAEKIRKEMQQNGILNNSYGYNIVHREDVRPSFSVSIAQDFGLHSSFSARPQYGVDHTANWRDFANGVKAMARRKGFDATVFADDISAIADAGKALGASSFGRTAVRIVDGFNTFANSLSKNQKRTISIPDVSTVHKVISSLDLRTTTISDPTDTSHVRNIKNVHSYRYMGHTKVSRYLGVPQRTLKDVSLTSKTGNQTLVGYGQFKKTPISSWRSGAGTTKTNRPTYASSMGVKGVKGAIKSNFINFAGRTDYDIFGFSSTKSPADKHVRTSINTAIAANWQLREMTKNEDILPKWKWNPQLVPYGDKNKLSHSQGVAGGPSSSRVAQTGSITIVDSAVFDDIMKDQYKNSVADTLGLRPDMKSVITGKAHPKIVLKTSQQSIADVEDKIKKDWTHASNTGVSLRSGYWNKNSVKVNHVFDIMYHDYYDEYKKRETAQGNVKYGYHGTVFQSAASIMKGGYKVPKRAKNGRAFGDGVYAAESSSKSIQYLRDSGFGRTGVKGPLLVNRIVMGKTTDPLNPTVGVHDRSYNSVWAGGKTGTNPKGWLDHDEWLIKDPKSIIPIQWIEVETV